MRFAVCRAVMTLVGIAGAGSTAAETAPWEQQPFSADPARVVAAATAATAGDEHDVVMLLDERVLAFDADGRRDSRVRYVYRIGSAAGARDWATVGASWAPWHERRPEVRARVVTPDGRAHDLDPATIAESSADQNDDLVFTDRRQLRAPLPAVAPGAVVEMEIHSSDHEPFFAAGTSHDVLIGWSVPLRRLRVSVEAPETLPLRHTLRGIDGLALERSLRDGRVRLTLEAGPLDPLTDPESWMPGDVARWPLLSFGTGRSWAEVASAYSRIVDAQIGVKAPAAALTGARREQVVERLVRRLHADVRYTGVEFGDAAIVPRRPDEVLARRYGDCKDKAALLVSWLRGEGVPAHVALVRTWPGSDVDPELPGLAGFDHVLVLVPGTPAVWIDATDPYSRVGVLPTADQDRWALVAAEGTIALVRTPSAAAADNLLRKSREYVLSETAGTRVVETTTMTGAIEAAYRSYYAETDAKPLREGQEKYAASEHGAGSIVAAENSDPRDTATPFKTRIESADAGRGVVDGAGASMSIALAAIFGRVPDVVTQTDEGVPHTPRRRPFVLSEPHRVEWNYHIVAPPGFVVTSLPEPVRESLGPAMFEARFQARPDGSVEGRLAFDSGPRQLTPEAFEALRTGLLRWRDHADLAVKFEHKARALLAAGKTCAALAELRTALQREPRKGELHQEYALALLEAGFGEAAREAARRAVALAATADSQRVLGWVLEHDALGRRFKPGADLAGAEAAYLAAKALDPKYAVARASLAVLYEFDAHGVQWGHAARLADSVREIEGLRRDLASDQLDMNLLLSLFYLGRFAELEQQARGLPATDDRNEMLVAAVGALRGAPAALAEAALLFADHTKRRDALLHAGNSLLLMRRYTEGAALLAESVAGADNAAERRNRALAFSRVKLHEQLPLPADDPRTAVKRLLIASYDQWSGKAAPADFDTASLFALDDPELRRAVESDPDSVGRVVVDAIRRAMRLQVGSERGPDMADVVLSLADFTADGDDENGWRVRMSGVGSAFSAFVVKSPAGYRVLASNSDWHDVAAEAWRRVGRGDVAGARRLLDWAREEFDAPGKDDLFDGAMFPRLWTKGGREGADRVRLAAATLFTRQPLLEAGIQALSVGREIVAQGDERDVADYALVQLHLRDGHPERALSLVERLHAGHPDSETLWAARLHALNYAGRDEGLRSLALARLRTHADDVEALYRLASTAAARGRYEEAEQFYGRLLQTGRGNRAGYLNNRAWLAIIRNRVDDDALSWAREAAQAPASASAQHTLATLYAETGHVSEARQLLLQRIGTLAGDTPESVDWYVVGRLAEQCGLAADARRAYERVLTDADPALDATAVLARRRLAQVEHTPGTGRGARPANRH